MMRADEWRPALQRCRALTSPNPPGGEGDGRVCRRPWCRFGALVLVIAALGLPINDLFRYALLVISTVAICLGTLSEQRRAWLGAVAAVAACVLGQFLWAAPRIEEGHNVFLIDAPGGALEATLPASAFQLMAAEFNSRYPPERRCPATTYGCWRGGTFPRQPYAFSSDAIYDDAAHSRRVTGIDFADPLRGRV